MEPEQTYSLNCALCGYPYNSKEAFPKEQVCPKCKGEKEIDPVREKRSTKNPLNKKQLAKDKKKKKQAKKSRKRNRKK